MKPGFALNLSPDGISLLHRAPDGWERVGDVPLDDPKLGETLGALRKTALGLEPQGLTTKLIIPNAQILYADIAAPGPDSASRRRQIRAALDGMTPYSVDELVFDWSPLDEGRVRVAVVARETLEEAEEFAADHRMAPVSFVAVPDPDQFTGEAFFGATRLSSSLLPPGERVERDQEAVRLADGSALSPLAVTPDVSEPGPVADKPDAEESEVAEAVEESTPTVDAEAPDDAEALRPGAAAAEPEIAGPETPPEVTAEPEAAWTEPELEPDQPVDVATEPELSEPTPAEPEERIEPIMSVPEVAEAGAKAEPSFPPEKPEQPAEPMAAEPETREPEEAAKTPEAAETSAEEPAEPRPAFSTRRAAVEPAAGEGAAGGPRLAAIPSRISLPGAPSPRPVGQPPLRADAAAPPRAKAGRKGVAAFPRVGTPAARPRVEITPRPPVEPVKSGVGLGGDALAAEARAAEPPAPAPTERSEAEAIPAVSQPAASDPAATGVGSGVFGSRTTTPVRGKPRHLGLILTVILLLFLGLVAVWASLFMGEPESQTGSLPATEVTPPEAVQVTEAGEQDAAPPMPGPEELLLAEDAPFVTEPGEEIPGEETAAGAVDDLPPPGGAALSPDAVAASGPGPAEVALQRPAESGAATEAEASRTLPVLPSLNAIAIDDPPSAQVDPAPAEAVLAALAAAEESAVAGAAPEAPAAAATPEAPVVAEEDPIEIEVVEGRPETVPPPNPFAEAEAPAETPQLDVTDAVLEALAAELPAEGSVQLIADPSLAGVRPRARPEQPEDAAADPVAAEEQGAVEPAPEVEVAPADLRLAALRPAPRPEALAPTVEPAAEPEAVVEEPAEPESGLAIASSVRPASRPSNFNAAVEQALAAALAAAPAPQQIARTAAAPVEVDEDNEPDITPSAVPSIPTRASVAAAATVTRGINLRQMNLIGVAGSANNRRALVRMSNGRVVQVKVGDRLDGGQVAAIGERQLRYVKSGRTHVLDIPQG